MFLPAGSHFAPESYTDLDEALANANVAVIHDQCGCTFGRCQRWSKNTDDNDWYEPHEPNLERAGLGHDHFLQK